MCVFVALQCVLQPTCWRWLVDLHTQVVVMTSAVPAFGKHRSTVNSIFRCYMVFAAVLLFVDAQQSRDTAWSLPPPPLPPPGVAATCDQRNSCGPQHTNAFFPFHARNCFCDEFCHIYDDCCADYTPLPLGGSGSLPPFNCHRVEDIDTSFEYYIVDRCPRHYSENATVQELCRDERLDDVFYRLPVAGRTSGILYRNAFCAICSDEKDYVFWRVEHRCSVGSRTQPVPNPELPEATLRQMIQCMPYLLPPEVADDGNANGAKRVLLPRKCKSHINKCKKRSKGRRRCTGPTAYVYDGLQVS